MTDRQSVTFVVLIETARQRWFAGAFGADGQAIPLIRSEEGNLDRYVGLDFDEQISFLRHRLAGVLQRGNDRLYGRKMKATQFLFVADGDLPNADPRVTASLAEHFVQWMINPPVVYLRTPAQFAMTHAADWEVVAGELPANADENVSKAISDLATRRCQPKDWELVVRPQS